MNSPLFRRQFLQRSVAAVLATSQLPRSVWSQSNAPVDATQTADSQPHLPSYSDTKTFEWKFGMSIRTPVAFTNGLATFPIPMDWPEQSVQIITRDVDSLVSHLQVRDLDGGARQVVLAIPRVTSNQSLDVNFTIRIDKRDIVAPADPSSLVIPQRVSREMRAYMGNSPMIDATHGNIRALSRELADTAPQLAWDRVRQIYDTVRKKVRYVEGPIRNASDALKEGEGDCEDMTSLFVALCRNAGVPARMVWIPGHCYPEFYLEVDGDGDESGAWYPCQAAGSELFGEMQEDRPVLQKGDRFRVVETKKIERYVSEFFRCDRRGNGSPVVQFSRQLVSPAGAEQNRP
ncbi:transglutaminase-like domain-containing protein [Neorhodopirellula pilleata]|uniref:Transglutaminase-like superfamily protein n=1 Tax=Neorhodopirellula pilleata TaxID=2714738 RepID=A0A5C5ZY68_9BACT|nr:transglutaminase-like domain-containing protein [Neorhodopirellula pilleata]TWT91867.1 Transglutaminase-like superfamily protein [Neorhodopirellula pilleata]